MLLIWVVTFLKDLYFPPFGGLEVWEKCEIVCLWEKKMVFKIVPNKFFPSDSVSSSSCIFWDWFKFLQGWLSVKSLRDKMLLCVRSLKKFKIDHDDLEEVFDLVLVGFQEVWTMGDAIVTLLEQFMPWTCKITLILI